MVRWFSAHDPHSFGAYRYAGSTSPGIAVGLNRRGQFFRVYARSKGTEPRMISNSPKRGP
jgi:hypothetical protein